MQTIRNTANSGTNKAKEQEERNKKWDSFLRSVGVDTNKNMFQQAAQYAQRQQQAQAANATQQRPIQYSQLNQQQRQTVNPLIRNSLQEIRNNLQMAGNELNRVGRKPQAATTQTTTTPAVQRTGTHPMLKDFTGKLQDRQQTMNRLQQEGIQQAKGIASMIGQAANTAKPVERKPENNLQRQHMLGAGEATPESLGMEKKPQTLRGMMRQAGNYSQQKFGQARNAWDSFIQQTAEGLKPKKGYIPENEGAEPNQTTYGDLRNEGKRSRWWIKDALDGKLTGNEKDEYIRSTSIAAFNSQFVQSINDMGKLDDQEGLDSYLYSPEKNRENANKWQLGVDYITAKLDDYKDHSWLTNPEGSTIDNAENAAMDLLGGNLDRLTMNGISYMDANGEWVTIGGDGGRNHQTIEDYQQNEEFYNQLAFRELFGQNALDIELAKNNGQLSDEYTAQMEKVWDHVLYDPSDLTLTLSDYQNKRDEALAMAETQEKYKATMDRADEDKQGMKNAETGFVAENENQNAGWQMGITVDKVYSFINGGIVMNDIKMQGERSAVSTDQMVGNALDGVGFMTPDEVKYFNAYVNDGNKEGAERFLEELKPSLKNRQRQWQEGNLQYLADRFPVLAAATSVATNKIQGFLGLADSVMTMLGMKTGNANDDMQFFSNMTETLRNTLNENVYNDILNLTGSEIAAKIAQSLTETGLSVADFTSDALIGTGFAALKGAKTPQEVAKIGKTVSLGLMTLESYGTSYHDALKETGDPLYASLTAFVDAATELSTETILGMDDIFDFGAEGMQFFLGAILGETVEEMEGSFISPFAQTLKDRLLGYFTKDSNGLNQWEKDALEIASNDPAYHYKDANGVDMIDQGKALKAALLKWGEDITWSAIGGGLGGGLGGIGTYGSMHAYERDTGKAVRGSEAVTEATYESGEKAGQTKSNEDYLIDIAAGMKEGSRARKLAMDMQKAKAAGKKISNVAVGRLASALSSETNERVNNAVKKSLSNQIAERLQEEKGSAAGTTQAADIVTKAITEGLPNLTKEERNILAHDPVAFDVYREFVEPRTQEEGSDFAGEAVNTAMAAGEAEGGEILENIRAMTDKGFRKARAAAKATAKIMQGQAETAAHRAAERHTDKLAVLDVGDGTGRTTSGKASEVVVGEEQAEIVGVKDGKYLVRSGEDTHTADMADVMATNKAMATTMSYIEMNRAAASDRFANLLIQGVNSGAVTDANVETYLNNANKIRIAAFHGQAMPQVKLDQKMVQMIYDQSRADAIAKDAQRTRPDNRIRLNPGNGAVKLMGVDSTDTKAYNAMLEQMGEAARDQVEAVASLFKKIGLNVSIVNDTSNKNVYGSYDIASGAVIVNLAGENQGGEQHHLLTTVSHELTHFLERNSREGYNALRQFVFEQIQQSGQDLNQLIENKINQYNAQISELNAKGESYDPITIDEAMAEVVADACDQVLSNEETINHLAQDNKGLYNKIRNFVKDFIGKIKKAAAGMERSSSRYSRMIQDADRLAKLWNIAFDEATEPVQIYEAREGATVDAPMAASLAEGKGKQFSFLGKDPETGRSIYMSNYAIGTPKTVKWERARNLIENVWSKKPIKLKVFDIGSTESRVIEANFSTEFSESGKVMTDGGKLVRGNRLGNSSERRMALNLVDDYLQIIDEAYYDSPEENREGHNPQTHSGIKLWHYFLDDIFYVEKNGTEMVPFRMEIDIKETTNGSFFYQIGGTIIEGEQNKKLDVTQYETVASNARSATDNQLHDVIIASENENGNVQSGKTQNSFAEALEQDIEASDGTETHYGDHAQFSLRVTDPETLDFLNNQETIRTYKTMQLIDGKLYPPMAAVVAGSTEDHSVLGQWEQATEHPELIKKGNKFTLNKGKGQGSLDAAYNPYMHSSNLVINDQFSGAYNRPNLVTVECEVPTSEMNGAYHAEFAKDSTGWHSWHTGTVAGKIRAQKGIERQVFLSRWIKPVRIVSDAETAAMYADLLEGTDIAVPDNVVSPSLLNALEEAGVKIENSGRVPGRGKQFSLASNVDYSDILEKQQQLIKLRDEIKEIKNSAEMQQVMDDIMKDASQENLDKYTAFLEKSGLTNKQRTFDRLQKEIEDFNKAWEENYKKTETTKERNDIEKSGLSEADYRKKQAIKEFGKTTNYREAGYMLNDGSMLNFSGEKGKHNGRRGQDHRNISGIFADPDISGWKAMREFMNYGNIRIMAEASGIDISENTQLTKEQISGIRKMVRFFAEEDGEFNIDFTNKNGDTLGSINYEGRITPDRVINDIQHFFQTGEVRQQSEIERFRFSMAELDNQYMAAAERGDTEAAQQLVDEAAKRQGYTMKVYHGTPYGGFTQFRDWSYFTENEAYANRYKNPSASSTRGRYNEATNPMTYVLYMNPGKVFDTRKKSIARLYNQIRMEQGMSELNDSGLPDWVEGRDLIDYIEENGLDYDTIILDEGADGGYGAEVVKRGLSYVTRSNMIKSAEAVTYDEDGNIIPLSKRFNQESNDIRFSVAELDERYTAALDDGNLEAARNALEEAARNNGYTTSLYHQTENDFTVFDTRHKGAGTRDNETPYGIFMKTGSRNIGIKGSKQMRLMAKIENPLRVNSREELVRKVQRLSEEYSKAYAQGKEIDREYNAKFEEAEQKFRDFLADHRGESREQIYNNPGFDEAFNASEKVTDEWTAAQSENDKKCKELMTKALQDAGYDGVIIKEDRGSFGRTTDAYIAFSPEQVKSAETITYDDDGNIIPLSERFNPESDDIRWSMAEMNTSAIDWLAEVTQEEGSSWAEREIMRQYRERTDAVTQTRAKMRQMEEDLKTAEGDAARKLRINLQTEQRKLDRQTASLNELTGSDSWREQMRRAQRMMNKILQGETQADIDQRVQDLKKQVEALKKQATQAADRAEKLGRDRDVAMMRSLFGKNALNKAATNLKKSMRSSMTVGEIENALASISLKFAAGDPTHMQEVEALAGRLAETGSADGWGTESYVTDALRGTTISLTAEQWAEMKKVGYDKKTVRSLLAGTGVQFTEGKTYIMPIDTLLQDYLVELVPELRDIAEGNDKDMAIRIVELLAKEKENREAGRPPVTQDEIRHNMMQVIETAAALRPVVEMSDSGVKQLLSNIRGYLQEVSGSAEQVTEQIREISQSMEAARTAATRVSGSASVLSRDTTEALDMLRTMGRAAASSSTAETDALKARLNKAIEYYRAQRAKLQAAASAEDMEKLRQTLESDATRRIMAERERWQQAIEQDKARRQLSQNRAKTRRQVERLYNRLTRLITEETDDKSIPEEYKSIARAALKSILQQELSGGKRITERDMKKLDRDHRVHDLIDQREGTDINLTVIEDEDIRDQIQQALDEINAGVEDFRNARGRSMPALEADAAALKRLHEGLKTVAEFIRAARETEINGRKILIADLAFEVDTAAKERDIHAERIGSIGQKMNLAEQKIYYGNMTPEYFFKSLKNKGLSTIWEAFHEGEDRSGILTQHFKEKIERIAEDNGYGTWDQSRKIRLELENGDSVNMTPEQMMSLYATYKREMKLNADMKEEVSHHLRTGGFVMEEQAEQMLYGKEAQRKVSHKFSGKDFAKLEELMDPSWKAYADAMVELMSTEGSALGNAASMRMYGIKKYNETYYFPFAVWDGVKNKASNAGAAINPTNNNRAAHQGFTNRLKAKAGNAVMIRNFSEVVAEHMTQMVTYSTMAPAIETMNKVLNYRVAEDADSGNVLDATLRNVEVVLEERYGKNATGYIRDLLRDLNGGVTQDRRGSMVESLMSIFKKNAVGGSLSVALQQPLSYIRAATMISPKYLAQALTTNFKGSYAEMMAHSGLAVIKAMGRFDMNYGQSAREYMTPEQAQKKGRAIYNEVVDKANILPELMDRATWTRMWTACKLEVAAQNPGADTSSNAFLDQVAERFNDVIRKTQVYDSVLVKSSNMRSTNWTARVITAFKAEPTLTANMLMDAWQNRKTSGGKKTMGAALGTYLLSAIMQAVIKAIMGAGRTPDEKKTLAENVANKFAYNFIGEANPLSLIPGYSEIVDALSGNEIKDNAYGVITNIYDSLTATRDIFQGKGQGAWRDVENTAGQITQIVSGIPLKNLMRDCRAIYNWALGSYADRGRTEEGENGERVKVPGRETSLNVIRYQTQDTLLTNDLIGAINKFLGDAGYKTSNTAYYDRIYAAERAGRKDEADAMREYLQLGKGATQKAVTSGVASAAKRDPNASAAETADYLLEGGYTDQTNYLTQQYKAGELTEQEYTNLMKKYFPDKDAGKTVFDLKMDQYKDGEITRAEAEKIYKQQYPDADKDSVWAYFDRIDYAKETGREARGAYYRVHDAIETNRIDAINKAVNLMLQHGKKKNGVWSSIEDRWKDEYLQMRNGSAEKVKLKDAIIKALKAAGFSATEAEKKLSKWK